MNSDPDGSYRRGISLATIGIIVAAIIGTGATAYYAAPGLFSLSPYSEMSTNLSVAPPATSYILYVSANSSNIQVFQGSNTSIYVQVTASGWFMISKQNLYVEANSSGSTVRLVIHTPSFLATTTSTAKVYLPVSYVAESLNLQTSNGNENVYGPLAAINISMSTSNGNIGTTGVSGGTLSATTVNGNINIETNESGGISADSVNGNIRVAISSPIRDGSFTMSSVNGNQNLYISRDSNATLDISTVNGNINVYNLQVSTTSSTSHDLQGSINGGGASIVMKTSNGNVSITGT